MPVVHEFQAPPRPSSSKSQANGHHSPSKVNGIPSLDSDVEQQSQRPPISTRTSMVDMDVESDEDASSEAGESSREVVHGT